MLLPIDLYHVMIILIIDLDRCEDGKYVFGKLLSIALQNSRPRPPLTLPRYNLLCPVKERLSEITIIDNHPCKSSAMTISDDLPQLFQLLEYQML